MKGFVYLLCDQSNNLFKIGMTRNSVSQRIKKLQTGNPTEIHMVKKYETDIPSFVESKLHQCFSSKQALNEWYDLTPEDISGFEDLCRKYDRIAEVLQDNPFFKVKKSPY